MQAHNSTTMETTTASESIPIDAALRAVVSLGTQQKAGQKRKLGIDASLDTSCKRGSRISVNPADYVTKIFNENGYEAELDSESIPFVKPTEAMIDAYQLESLKAARQEDVGLLRNILNSGVSLNACNRFGESLAHLSARRGNVDMIKFLVEEANVSLLLRDDFGRTILHDAFWTSSPRFELVDYLIRRVPDLLCVKDVRGHTPLCYVRKEHWDDWIAFLQTRKAFLRPKLSTRC
jgi:Ankyrin repeats (3 copies)